MPPVEGGVVAVTGASGFIGSWVVVELLRAGYEVRALVRDASNEAKTAHLLTKARELGKEAALRFFSGDLSQAGDYDEAFSGADAVVHTAAVVAIRAKDPLRDIVEPSIIGTQNVLASADRSKTVKRIIHTSSVAAIQSYDKPTDYIFTERDEATWSTIARGDPYGYAKLSAERLVREAGLASPFYDTVSINPVVVFGPCLTKAHTKASPSFLRQFLYGNKAPDAWVSVVDVRDVAAAHVVALNKVECAGQRYIIGAYRRTANERVLRAKLKLCQTNRSHRPCLFALPANAAEDSSAGRLSTLGDNVVAACPDLLVRPRFIPGWQVTVAFHWPWLLGATALGLLGGGGATLSGGTQTVLGATLTGLGVVGLGMATMMRPKPYVQKVFSTEVRFSAEKSRRELGLQYRELHETLRDTALSMVEPGWVKVQRREGGEKQPLKSSSL